MKFTTDQLNSYMNFVKKTFNRDLDANQAYDEFYKLLTVVARCYLPKEVMKLFEINSEMSYNKNAIHRQNTVSTTVSNNEYKKG